MLCVGIIVISFFFTKKGQKRVKTIETWKIINKNFSFSKFVTIKRARDLWAGNMPIHLFQIHACFSRRDLIFFKLYTVPRLFYRFLSLIFKAQGL